MRRSTVAGSSNPRTAAITGSRSPRGGGGLSSTQIYLLAVDPGNSRTVYVGFGHRLLRTTDGGETWEQIADEAAFGPNSLMCLALDPQHPEFMWVDSRGTGIGDLPRGVYRSRDRGETWQLVRRGPTDQLILVPGDPPRLYAFVTNEKSKCLAVSLDQGETWNWVPLFALEETEALAHLATGSRLFLVDPVDTDRLFIQMREAIFYSRDGGATWRVMAQTWKTMAEEAFASLLLDPLRSGTLYAGYVAGGIQVSRDHGTTWALLGNLPEDTGFAPMGIDPTDPDIIYASSNYYGYPAPSGLYRSEDGGQTWLRASRGLSGVWAFAVAFDPATPGAIYARVRTGPRSQDIVSENLAETWSVFSGDTSRLWGTFQWAGSNPQIGYKISDGGIARTKDGGKTWTAPVHLFPDPESRLLTSDLDIHPCSPYEVFAIKGGGLYRSDDGARTWTRTKGSNLDGLYLSEMAIDPLDPSTIYAYTGPIDFSGRWALLRSDDGGAAWTELEIGWPDEGATHYFDYLAVDLNGRAFVASHLGIFASTDRGISWSPVHAGLPPVEVNQLLVDPQGRGKIYAATSGGIFVLELSEPAVAEAATECAIPPAEPSLAQNFPNPFNPTTTIAYVLPTAGTVRLQIYDIGGQLVRRLLAERRPSGLHQVVWDGRDDAGATVATGAYLCELRTGTFRSAIKMILIH